jgi:hypothetical protein
MKDVLLFFLFLILAALGLAVAVATVFWWAVWLIAFPLMYVGALGAIASYGSWKKEEKPKQR